jgi:hypothetical protein
MNWKKILLSGVLAPIAVSLGAWGTNSMAGTHIPFTFGTIGIPSLLVMAKGFLDLFQTPPHQQP